MTSDDNGDDGHARVVLDITLCIDHRQAAPLTTMALSLLAMPSTSRAGAALAHGELGAVSSLDHALTLSQPSEPPRAEHYTSRRVPPSRTLTHSSSSSACRSTA